MQSHQQIPDFSNPAAAGMMMPPFGFNPMDMNPFAAMAAQQQFMAAAAGYPFFNPYLYQQTQQQLFQSQLQASLGAGFMSGGAPPNMFDTSMQLRQQHI